MVGLSSLVKTLMPGDAYMVVPNATSTSVVFAMDWLPPPSFVTQAIGWSNK